MIICLILIIIVRKITVSLKLVVNKDHKKLKAHIPQT